MIKWPAGSNVRTLMCSRRAIQSRYLVLYNFVKMRSIYVVDTFHGDIQYVALLLLIYARLVLVCVIAESSRPIPSCL